MTVGRRFFKLRYCSISTSYYSLYSFANGLSRTPIYVLFWNRFRPAKTGINSVSVRESISCGSFSEAWHPGNHQTRAARAFFEETGGNPLFLHETVLWLKWRYTKEQRELTADDVYQLEVPDSVDKLLRFRLDSL